MTRLNQYARALDSVWDQAEALGDMSLAPRYPMRRPEQISVQVRQLSKGLWPDCPLCGHVTGSGADHDCDPDEVQQALLAARVMAEREREGL